MTCTEAPLQEAPDFHSYFGVDRLNGVLGETANTVVLDRHPEVAREVGIDQPAKSVSGENCRTTSEWPADDGPLRSQPEDATLQVGRHRRGLRERARHLLKLRWELRQDGVEAALVIPWAEVHLDWIENKDYVPADTSRVRAATHSVFLCHWRAVIFVRRRMCISARTRGTCENLILGGVSLPCATLL